MAKSLALYDKLDPGAARVIIVAGSDFEGTSPKLYWPETLVYLLPGAELNQMLTLVVATKSEMPCEPELLLFTGMNDHLHAAGLLEHLKGEAQTPKKIWKAIQTFRCRNLWSLDSDPGKEWHSRRPRATRVCRLLYSLCMPC